MAYPMEVRVIFMICNILIFRRDNVKRLSSLDSVMIPFSVSQNLYEVMKYTVEFQFSKIALITNTGSTELVTSRLRSPVSFKSASLHLNYARKSICHSRPSSPIP